MPTPGLIRSSQLVDVLGVARLRTTMTTTDWVQMPLVALSFQSSATMPSSTSRVDVGLEGEVDLVGVLAGHRRRGLWSPEAP